MTKGSGSILAHHVKTSENTYCTLISGVVETVVHWRFLMLTRTRTGATILSEKTEATLMNAFEDDKTHPPLIISSSSLNSAIHKYYPHKVKIN